MPSEAPHPARRTGAVRVPSGRVYVVQVVRAGQFCDPWVFVDPVDAELRFEAIRQYVMDNPDEQVLAGLYEAGLVRPGVEPPLPPELARL